MQCWVMIGWAQGNAIIAISMLCLLECYMSAGLAYSKLKLGDPKIFKKETKPRDFKRLRLGE